MSNEAKELLQKALNLPEEERVELVSGLWDSLPASFDAGVEAEWDAEIERRIADLDSGRVKPLTRDEALALMFGEGRGAQSA